MATDIMLSCILLLGSQWYVTAFITCGCVTCTTKRKCTDLHIDCFVNHAFVKPVTSLLNSSSLRIQPYYVSVKRMDELICHSWTLQPYYTTVVKGFVPVLPEVYLVFVKSLKSFFLWHSYVKFNNHNYKSLFTS